MPAPALRHGSEEGDAPSSRGAERVLDQHRDLAIGVLLDVCAAQFGGDVRLRAPLELRGVALALLAYELLRAMAVLLRGRSKFLRHVRHSRSIALYVRRQPIVSRVTVLTTPSVRWILPITISPMRFG